MTDGAKPILVVEDNAEFCRLLTVYLKRFGQKVVAAKDGHEALRAFTPGGFALLLADVNLGGGMNGIEVAKQLVEKEPGLKVFIMSGEPASLAEAKAAGFPHCLTKPLDFDHMPQLLGLSSP